MKVADWDITKGRKHIRPYFGSHRFVVMPSKTFFLKDDKGSAEFLKRCRTETKDGSIWGRDFSFQFLGLHLYIAIEW